MRERRNYLLIIGAICVLLVGALFLAVPGSPAYKAPVKGLDLQGGLEVVLQAVPTSPKQPVNSAGMQTAQQVMTNRVNHLGTTSPNIAIQGGNQMVIQLAGVKDPNKAAKIIGTTGQLQMFDFEPSLEPPTVQGTGISAQPAPLPSLYSLLTAVKKEASKGTPQGYFLFQTIKKPIKSKVKDKTVTKFQTIHKVLNPTLPFGAPDLKQLLLPYKDGKQPPNTQILKVPANREPVWCKSACIGAGRNGTSKDGKYWYLFKYTPPVTLPNGTVVHPDGPPEITGKDLVESGIQATTDQTTGGPIVQLQFTGHGGKEFQAITKAEYNRGRFNAGQAGQLSTSDTNTINQYAGHNAIVLDGQLRSTPYIDYTDGQLSEGIAGGSGVIQTPTASGASQLAFVLKSGSLPYTFKQLSQTTVTATLGKSSLHEAILAAIAGLTVVAIFLLVLYRFLGLVAVFGLAVYALLYYAAILLFNVTLTLPGFAGLILTIGVAADANVVVFERIKEEVRAGRSVRAAVSAGYGKGFHTILDANVVTMITALVIFLVATADVKGFALMLLIGTVISLLTAVAATRALLGLLSGFKWFDSPRFMGAQGQQTAKWLQIDFMGKRKTWFAISGAIIVAGLISLGAQGLNLGIDFKGGTQFTFFTHQPYSQAQVQSFMAKQGQPDAVVQGKGKTVNGGNKDWQVRTKSLDRTESTQLAQALKSDLGTYGGGSQNVSGTFGHQIAVAAIYAIIVSLLLITIYIALRFDLKFAVPVILAMVHDILITIGVYSLVGKEVTVDTVAAVLTVLGYSIYDTIIIFDRIRENVPLMRRSPFATIANVSLWETIRRSLATTFITLLPIICLLIFGGATLKDFAFALIVGVISGAYSSIFIAAPLLTMWKEREPEYARRKKAAEQEGDDPDGGTPARRRPWRPKGGPALDPGTLALEESEAALAAEPTPGLLPPTPSTEPATASARREKRQQRRRSRPHGRSR
ncbi:MAG TPA: protein translocase subunit SecF [Gaiellaceae bacterium]|nr:protein translocase subunit SecF [Gaiellaceae bacterium]